MEIVDAIVIITVVWSLVAAGWLYINTWSMKSKEIETLKEEGRQLRQNTRPREWWQELLIAAAQNPELLDKVEKLISMSGNPGVQALLDRLKQQR